MKGQAAAPWAFGSRTATCPLLCSCNWCASTGSQMAKSLLWDQTPLYLSSAMGQILV